MPPFVRHCAAHAHVLDVHVTLYVKENGSRSKGWQSNVEMRVDTLIWDALYPPHEILEKDPLGPWSPKKPSSLGPLAFGFWERQTFESPS
jgi:hypothetical protein